MEKNILDELCKHRLKNLEIINLINSKVEFTYQKFGNSYLFKFDSNVDKFNIHIVSDNEMDVKLIIKNLGKNDTHIVSSEDWILDLIRAKKKIVHEEITTKYSLPDNVEMKNYTLNIEPIRIEDAVIVDKKWVFTNENSYSYILSRIKNEVTAAIYKNGRIIAWNLTHSDGSLGILYVEEEYRKRNFAYEMTSYMVQNLRAKSKIPFFFILKGNVKSTNLAQKIGFEKSGTVHWLITD